MQVQPVVADERQDAVTRLCPGMMIIDGLIILLTVIVPVMVVGPDAWADQIRFFTVPAFICMAISSISCVDNLQKIDPGRMLLKF